MSLFISKIIRITILFSVIITLGFTDTFVKAFEDNEITITSIDNGLNKPMGIKSNEIGIARSEQVRMNSQGIDQIAYNLRVNQGTDQQARFQIFSDLNLKANFNVIEDTIHSGYLMAGTLDGDPNSLITLASTDGFVSANLEFQGKQYHLKSDEYGNYSFEEIDQSQFPEELEAIPDGADVSGTFTDENFDVPLYDSAYVIDVMVVYTSTARTRIGGTSQMQNLINLAVSETNVGYQRSGINSFMRLVHSVEVNYDESIMSSSNGWNTALSNLTNNDGVIDNIHNLRDSYGADLVVMIVESSTYCGLGWLMTPNYQYDSVGFSLVSRTCATGYYSFAHETGHNMGAHHDRSSAGGGTAMYSYSYGYQAPDSSFRTIMAYNCPSSCTRINQWSNPDVYYNNQPTGIQSTAPNGADNRLTLNKTAPIVANFKSPIPTAPAPITNLKVFSSTNSITLDWTADITTTSYEVQISNELAKTVALDSSLDITQIPYTINGLERGVTYSITIISINDFGSTVNDPIRVTTPSHAIFLPLTTKN